MGQHAQSHTPGLPVGCIPGQAWACCNATLATPNPANPSPSQRARILLRGLHEQTATGTKPRGQQNVPRAPAAATQRRSNLEWDQGNATTQQRPACCLITVGLMPAKVARSQCAMGDPPRRSTTYNHVQPLLRLQECAACHLLFAARTVQIGRALVLPANAAALGNGRGAPLDDHRIMVH